MEDNKRDLFLVIAVLSALEEEVRDWKKGMSINKTSEYPRCRIYEGQCNSRNSLLVLTGMGKECAEKATNFILEEFPVGALISTGFGGALNQKTRAGDIVVYSELSYEESRNNTYWKALLCDSKLVSAASHLIYGADFQTLQGIGVTVSEVCCTPDAKYHLGRDFSADVVDMESYWIGQVAAGYQIPFLAVRSIFDTVQDDVSALNHILIGGKVRPLKALSHFVCHPGQVKQTANYSTSYRKAGKNLAIFLDNLIQEIETAKTEK